MKNKYVLYGGIIGGVAGTILLLVIRYTDIDFFVRSGGYRYAYLAPFAAGAIAAFIKKKNDGGILPYVKSLGTLYGSFVIGVFICLIANFIIVVNDPGITQNLVSFYQ